MRKFWDQTIKTKDCWIWTGDKRRRGYGRFWINGKSVIASRFAYELSNNCKIPKGKIICHKCDNPSCVNPKHLWLGTNKENSIDMIQKGRGQNQFKPGEEHNNAKLTKSKIKEIRKSSASQRNLARKFNVHQCTISRIQNNKRWPSASLNKG